MESTHTNTDALKDSFERLTADRPHNSDNPAYTTAAAVFSVFSVFSTFFFFLALPLALAAPLAPPACWAVM
jgi:hypothetical protein